jgi:malto-oligosyltrehalose trehalohydrolase
VRRRRRLPFGAERLPDGPTRFRLWAPAARDVAIRLEAPGRDQPMASEAGGWFALVTEAPPGTRYRYRVADGLLVPDPASRFQPGDVHGPSEVVDPAAYRWSDGSWGGIPSERLVLYELHVGTFTPAGTFRGVAERLPHLVDLGVTAVELMPVAAFPGRRGWGYDGVLPFAPMAAYGRPDDLKALVDACHRHGLAVLLDVVYNHLGPEGNYLGHYAPAFFSRRHRTPWGAALNFDEAASGVVRTFVIENALYWLEEYHVDGLRLDAVHAMTDDSDPPLLVELAHAVHEGPGRDRHVHLLLENEANEARYLRPDPAGRRLFRAQWNDDLHHALHVLLTGEGEGYYADYEPPLPRLARCLAEGFAYQGDWSAYRGHQRGEPSRGLPPTAFVGFLQNHDQVGNRALGERIHALAPAAAVRAATAVLLLAPSLPALFMGQEWAAREPFLFFSDLGPDLADAVREGRRREFARFPAFADPAARARIPDPQAPETHARSVLDWAALAREPHAAWLRFHRELLAIRHRVIVPLLAGEAVAETRWRVVGGSALEVLWEFPRGATLRLLANLGAVPVTYHGPRAAWGRIVYALGLVAPTGEVLPPWSVAFFLRAPE